MGWINLFSFAYLGDPNMSISRARSSSPTLFYRLGLQSKTYCQWGTWNCLSLLIKTVLVANLSYNKKTTDLLTSRAIPVNLRINCKDKLCFRIQHFLGKTFLWPVTQSPLSDNCETWYYDQLHPSEKQRITVFLFDMLDVNTDIPTISFTTPRFMSWENTWDSVGQ